MKRGIGSSIAVFLALLGCGTSPAGPLAGGNSTSADANAAATDGWSAATSPGADSAADSAVDATADEAALSDGGAEFDGSGADTSAAGDGDAAVGETVDAGVLKACTEWTQAACALSNKCYAWLNAGKDPAVCPAQGMKSCLQLFTFPGTSYTQQGLEACAAAMKNATCSEYSYGTLKACESPKGSLADGTSCVRSFQCQSTYCTTKPAATGLLMCGKCAPKAQLGAPCTSNGQCADDLLCHKQVCMKPAAMGDPCGASAPCKRSGYCSPAGICKPFAVGGEACPVPEACALHQGFHCGSSSQTCLPFQVSTVGLSCGALGPTSEDFTVCAAGGECMSAGGGGGKVCKPLGTTGSPCGGGKDPQCGSGLECAAGACTDLEASPCP